MREKITNINKSSFIFWGASLCALIGFAYYIYRNFAEYSKLLQLSPSFILLSFLLCVSFPFINSAQNVLLYRELGAKISYWNTVAITSASTLVNQLPVPGGVISRAFYLNQKYNISFSVYASATLTMFICYISVSGFIGLTVLIDLYFFQDILAPLSLFTGYALMLSSTLLFFLPLKFFWLPEEIKHFFDKAIFGFKILSKQPRFILKQVAWQFLLMLFLAVRYWLAFRMLSQNITISRALLLSTSSILTQVVSIAPGGLGVREVIIGGVSSVLGMDMSIGILASGLDRIISTIVIFITGIISMLVLAPKNDSVSN